MTVQFSPAIIEEKVGQFEVHKSVSPDNMHPGVLKELEGFCQPALLTSSPGQWPLRRFWMSGILPT